MSRLLRVPQVLMILGAVLFLSTGLTDVAFFATEQHPDVIANMEFSDLPFDPDTVIWWDQAPDIFTKLFNEDEGNNHFYPEVPLVAFRFVVRLSEIIRQENTSSTIVSIYAGYSLHYIGDASCITHYAGSGGRYDDHVQNEFFTTAEHHDIEVKQRTVEVPSLSRTWHRGVDLWQEILDLQGRTRSRAVKARDYIDNNGMSSYLDSDLFIDQTKAQLQDAVDISNLALHEAYYKTPEELNKNYIVIGDYPFHLGIIKYVTYALGGFLILSGYYLYRRGVR